MLSGFNLFSLFVFSLAFPVTVVPYRRLQTLKGDCLLSLISRRKGPGLDRERVWALFAHPAQLSGSRRSTFTEGAIMERAEYRHSRARMAETAKDASRHPAPDAPERIDHRRRCTRHDHRTCCRGSRGSASDGARPYRATRCENTSPETPIRQYADPPTRFPCRRPILNATTSPLDARRYTRASSPKDHSI